MPEQPTLLDLPIQAPSPAARLAELPAGCQTAPPQPKYEAVVREQMMVAQIVAGELIGPDHKARAIWELLGSLDLGKFAERIKSRKGGAGRPAWEPRLLCSIWVYGYSEGISSARELERLMQYEPGLMWLTGLRSICHHTVSDFRVSRKAELDEMFVQLLKVMEEAKLVSLERVMVDGSKIRARAAAGSFRSGKTAQEKLAQLRELVNQDPRGEGNKRREAAQQRARREQEDRIQAALDQMKKLQEKRGADQENDPVRASLIEPEARMMKHGDGGIGPSYNMQVSTEASHGVIVGMELTQNASDDHELVPAVEEVKRNLGRDPQQVVADGGYINRDSIRQMEERKIDLIGPMKDPRERTEASMKASGIDPKFAPHFFILHAAHNSLQCPAGKILRYVRNSQKRGNRYRQYQASASDCQQCPFQKQCCPKNAHKGRTVSWLEKEQEAVARFREKMGSEAAQHVYQRRSRVAEFPFAGIKDKYGLRKFRVFSLVKAAAEAKWAALTHNALIWVRLCWNKGERMAPALA